MSVVNYSVAITMSQATVSDLVNSNYYLYGFKGVQSSDRASAPLVWLRTQSYSVNTNVAWSTQYQAYTSPSPLRAGQPVNVGFAEPITLGQLLTVQQSSGTGAVNTDGNPGSISILNDTSTQMTCGITEQGEQGAQAAPVCAMPLYGNGLQLVVPVPTILLVFATLPIAPSTAVTTSYGPGIMVNQATSQQCAVTFDINEGWSGGGEPNIQVVPPHSNLVPLLAQYSESLATSASAAPGRAGMR